MAEARLFGNAWRVALIAAALVASLAPAPATAAPVVHEARGVWSTMPGTGTYRPNQVVFAVPGGLLSLGGSCCSNIVASRYDEAAGAWSSPQSLPGSHSNSFGAGQLASGAVLVVGGNSFDAHTWDPSTSSWASVSPMPWSYKAYEPLVVGLADGRGLVLSAAGNFVLDVAGQWTAISTPPVNVDRAVALSDGTVLVIGGDGAARWEPASDTWRESAAPPSGYTGFVLVVSGTDAYAFGGYDESQARLTFRYDAANDRWDRLGDLRVPRREPGTAVASNGRIVAVGGYSPNYWRTGQSAEVLDPATGAWTLTARLPNTFGDVAATVLGDRVVALADYGAAAVADLAAVAPPSDVRVETGFPSPVTRAGVATMSHTVFDATTAAPVSNMVLQFAMRAGSAAPTAPACSAVCRSDANGAITSSYQNNTAAGTDVVEIHLDVDEDGARDDGEQIQLFSKTWLRRPTATFPAGPFELTAEPTGIKAVLSWRYAVSSCGYSTCSYIYAPVVGRSVSLYERGSARLICTAVTGADGAARCPLPTHKLDAIRAGGFAASFQGDAMYDSSYAEKTTPF